MSAHKQSSIPHVIAGSRARGTSADCLQRHCHGDAPCNPSNVGKPAKLLSRAQCSRVRTMNAVAPADLLGLPALPPVASTVFPPPFTAGSTMTSTVAGSAGGGENSSPIGTTFAGLLMPPGRPRVGVSSGNASSATTSPLISCFDSPRRGPRVGDELRPRDAMKYVDLSTGSSSGHRGGSGRLRHRR